MLSGYRSTEIDLVQAYELRGAGAVLHSHSLNAVMATLLHEDAKEFKVTHLEMIKVPCLSAARRQLHACRCSQAGWVANELPYGLHPNMLKARRDLFRATQGIAGHGYYGNCVVPIIENTARECELTGKLVISISAHIINFRSSSVPPTPSDSDVSQLLSASTCNTCHRALPQCLSTSLP